MVLCVVYLRKKGFIFISIARHFDCTKTESADYKMDCVAIQNDAVGISFMF